MIKMIRSEQTNFSLGTLQHLPLGQLLEEGQEPNLYKWIHSWKKIGLTL